MSTPPTVDQMACLQQGGMLWVNGKCQTVAEFMGTVCAAGTGGVYNPTTGQCEPLPVEPPAPPSPPPAADRFVPWMKVAIVLGLCFVTVRALSDAGERF